MNESEAPEFISFAHLHDHPSDQPTHNVPGRHAWVVVGEETIFLCHLIMGWMQGHNYEAVLEVSLPRDAAKEIRRDRKEKGHTHFLGNQGDTPSGGGGGHDGGGHGGGEGTQSIFRPPHTIPSLQCGRVKEFRADVWDYFPSRPCRMEWPYPPRKEFLKDVKVTVKRVVHYRHINPNITAQRHESYFLFGKGKEAHIYHNVVDQPDYDQVATLAGPPGWLQDDQLEAGVIVSVPSLPWSATSTHCVNPLPDRSRQPVLYHGIRRYRDPALKDPKKYAPVPPLEIEVKRTWWFSTRVVNWPPECPCGPGIGDIPTPSWPPGSDQDCPPPPPPS